ncbi:MAG: hypothetical protein JWR83_899 [Aeromicrobium sp.]|nr:hypothetical protein [Aeromicrobium sp.]
MATTTIRPAVPSSTSTTLATDFTILRICNWSSVVYIVLGLTGFAVFAGFWPPPAEHLDAAQISAYFRDHHTGIRIGMVLMVCGAPFYYVWSAVLSKIISRIEGPMGVLSTVELLGGLLTALVTIMPAIVWMTATFRPDARSDQTIQTLYDFGWLFFDLTFVCSLLQSVALGLAIQVDRRVVPLIPRWVGWLCFLVAATYVPLSLVPFLHSGPFAWHGLISFWAVFVIFFVQMVVVTPAAFTALRRLESEMSE